MILHNVLENNHLCQLYTVTQICCKSAKLQLSLALSVMDCVHGLLCMLALNSRGQVLSKETLISLPWIMSTTCCSYEALISLPWIMSTASLVSAENSLRGGYNLLLPKRRNKIWVRSSLFLLSVSLIFLNYPCSQQLLILNVCTDSYNVSSVTDHQWDT